ncbi:MAG: hypothetical protein EBZ48_01870 [Proteobacteria bacterium]|nr:hypothetical protein [Pseudomonadota bacterium]
MKVADPVAAPNNLNSPDDIQMAALEPSDSSRASISTRLSQPDLSPSGALESVEIYVTQSGEIILGSFPQFVSSFAGKVASANKLRQVTLYTLDARLQKLALELVRKADAPHVAIVAMEPGTGRILAMAQRSNSISNLLTHAGFPAASLFKIVTAAAALEQTQLQPDSVIRFRGGTYVLERWNYIPDPRRDRNSMTIRQALAKSCNAVFGRIGSESLSSDALRRYVSQFGFNQPIKFERPLPVSKAAIPQDDAYLLSRTAAGFGDVKISPIHAAAMMSGVANGGVMPRPIMVDSVLSSSGDELFRARPEMVRRMMSGDTAHELLEMMESTTTEGTSRRAFMVKNRPVLGDISVAAKTGTLSGDDPVGLNHWFIAAAPLPKPSIAVSVIVINPSSHRWSSSQIGRRIIEEYLR